MSEALGMKDVLDWTIPLLLTWVGAGVQRYLKDMRNSMVSLNLKIAQLLERVDAHGRELERHEKRINQVEQKLPRR